MCTVPVQTWGSRHTLMYLLGESGAFVEDRSLVAIALMNSRLNRDQRALVAVCTGRTLHLSNILMAVRKFVSGDWRQQRDVIFLAAGGVGSGKDKT